ncbi:MAG: hypothetical protein MUD03_02745 [Pirellula sp.]|nr:hypothetical protein [Pirellula sp.]
MSSKNIQKLFASITLEGIQSYMGKAGWSSLQRGERLDFQRENTTDGSMQTLFITSSEVHPKFRSLVPNLVFNLSVLEAREASEIAQAIFDQGIELQSRSNLNEASLAPTEIREKESAPRGKEDSPNSKDERWIRIRNTSRSTVSVSRSIDSGRLQLKGGESIFLPVSLDRIDVEIDSDVAIFGGEGKELPAFLDLPGRRFSNRRIIEQEAIRVMGFGAASNNDGLQGQHELSLESFKGMLNRFFFANGVSENLQGTISPSEDSRRQLLRSLAVLLTDLVSRFTSKEDNSRSLFEFSRWILAIWGITFTAHVDAPFQLYSALLSDQGGDPIHTLEWLELHSRVLTDW